MSYTECQLVLKPFRPFNEIVVVHLSELGFESFLEDEEEGIVKAFIPTSDFKEVDVCRVLDDISNLEYELSSATHEKVNWNQKWEERFDPIEVGTFCFIRAPFHSKDQRFEHEIIIEPKMSFGTGHHQTTQMMIELMEKVNFSNKTVLDMGSGTGILAILAKKMSAGQVDAIDIEEWAYQNMKENFQRNKVEVKGELGDAKLLENSNSSYDFIFANINKNILLADLKTYDRCLNEGGVIFLSGFYSTDEEELLSSETLSNYQLERKLNKEGWSSLMFRK